MPCNSVFREQTDARLFFKTIYTFNILINCQMQTWEIKVWSMITFLLVYFTAFSQLISLLSKGRMSVKEGVRNIWGEAFMVRHFINHKCQAIFAHFRLHQFSPIISCRSPTCTVSALLVVLQNFSWAIVIFSACFTKLRTLSSFVLFLSKACNPQPTSGNASRPLLSHSRITVAAWVLPCTASTAFPAKSVHRIGLLKNSSVSAWLDKKPS